jgi:hypothetical protein
LATTRILLAALPQMLADIVSEVVAHEPDMQVVGAVDDSSEIADAALAVDADFLVVGVTGGALPDACEALLELNPAARVLAVARDGRQSFLYRLEPRARPLGELDPGVLVSAIRSPAWRRVRPRRPLNALSSEG